MTGYLKTDNEALLAYLIFGLTRKSVSLGQKGASFRLFRRMTLEPPSREMMQGMVDEVNALFPELETLRGPE